MQLSYNTEHHSFESICEGILSRCKNKVETVIDGIHQLWMKRREFMQKIRNAMLGTKIDLLNQNTSPTPEPAKLTSNQEMVIGLLKLLEDMEDHYHQGKYGIESLLMAGSSLIPKLSAYGATAKQIEQANALINQWTAIYNSEQATAEIPEIPNHYSHLDPLTREPLWQPIEAGKPSKPAEQHIIPPALRVASR